LHGADHASEFEWIADSVGDGAGRTAQLDVGPQSAGWRIVCRLKLSGAGALLHHLRYNPPSEGNGGNLADANLD